MTQRFLAPADNFAPPSQTRADSCKLMHHSSLARCAIPAYGNRARLCQQLHLALCKSESLHEAREVSPPMSVPHLPYPSAVISDLVMVQTWGIIQDLYVGEYYLTAREVHDFEDLGWQKSPLSQLARGSGCVTPY